MKARHVPEAVELRQGLKIAQRLRHSGCRSVGLLAAGPGVDPQAVALRLAPLLAAAGDGPVEVVLVEETDHRHRNGDAPVWLGVGVDVVRVPRDALTAHILHARERYAHQLVPLGPLEERGEHADAYDALDGVVLALLAGRATERDVLERYAHLDHPCIGTLLLRPS